MTDEEETFCHSNSPLSENFVEEFRLGLVDHGHNAQDITIIDEIPTSSGNSLRSSKRKAGPLRQRTLEGNVAIPVVVFSNPHLTPHFKPLDEVGGKVRVQCQVVKNDKICGIILSKQKDTNFNLKRHLMAVHQIQLNDDSAVRDQPRIESHMACPSYPLNHPLQRRFDYDIQNLICLDGVPPNIVEKPAFWNMILNLDPKLRIKYRKTYMNQIRKEVATTIVPGIAQMLNENKRRNTHFTCDIWSTRRREGVFGVKVHFIDKDWTLISKVIGFHKIDVAHTADNIKDAFQEVLDAYDVPISQVGVVVTDNARNMIAAVNLLSVVDDVEIMNYADSVENEADDNLNGAYVDSDIEETHGLESDEDDTSSQSTYLSEDRPEGIFGHHGCIAHTIQLAVNDALKNDQTARDFINFVQSVMVFFKRSTKWSDELRKLTSLDVYNPCPTRWNGVLDMLNRFQQRPFFAAVRDVLDLVHELPFDAKNSPGRLTVDFLTKAVELHLLLRPVGDITDTLQQDTVTANNVIISLVSCVKRLRDVNTTQFSSFKVLLLENFSNRFSETVKKEDFIMATFLDPRQKYGVFEDSYSEDFELPVPLATYAHDVVELNFNREHEGGSVQRVDDSQHERTSQVRTLYDNLPGSRRSASRTLAELERYVKEGLSDPEEEPLQYWRLSAAKYPVLSELARHYLAIPASTGSVERLFSVAGWLVKARRARMTMENLCNILLLRDYRKTAVLKKLRDNFGANEAPVRKKKRRD